MATEVERMIAVLEANFKNYDKALNQALGKTQRTFKGITKEGDSLEKRLSALGGKVAVAFGGAAFLRTAQQLVDASSRIKNGLKVAGLSGDELSAVYDRLYQSAQRNFAPFETLATLYARAAQNQKELGVSSEELLTFTDNVALALRVAGTDAQTASGALLQLGQALGSGRVQAEEFNSVLEGAPTIVQAAAAGIKEAGGSVAALKKLVIEGKVSSAAFFQGFAAGSVVLKQQVAGAQTTVAQGFTDIYNAGVYAAGKMDETTGISRDLAREAQRLVSAIDALAVVFGDLSGPIATADAWLASFQQRMSESAVAVNKLITASTNRGTFGQPVSAVKSGGGAAPSLGDSITGQAVSTSAANAGNGPTVKPVSLADFKVPGGGGAEKSAARRAEAWKRETEALQDRNQQIALDISLLGQSTYAVEKYRAQLDLEQAAARAGVPITAERRNQIEQLAEQYGLLSQKMQDASLAQQQADQAAADAYGAVKSGLMDVISGTATWEDALAGVLQRLAEIAASNALDALFSPSSGGAGGGVASGIMSFIGKLLGGGFAGGGYTGAGGASQPAGVVHRGEYVMSKAAVDRIGVGRLDALHASLKGYAMGGYVGTPQIAAPSRGGGGSSVTAITVDLRGTTGDKELDQKLKASAAAVYSQTMKDAKRATPGWLAEHQAMRG